MTRQEMIDALVNTRLDELQQDILEDQTWAVAILAKGLIGYEDYSDEALREEYETIFAPDSGED